VGAAWLPLLLLSVELGLGGRLLAGVLGTALVVAMLLLGGHPDLFLMGSLLVGLLALFHPQHGVLRARRGREALQPVTLLLGGYALGIAMAAAQMLPTLGLAVLAWQRHGASAAYQDTWSLRPVQFLVQLLPDYFGRNGQDTYWGLAHYWEECSYVGALALGLALVGLVSRHRLARFYGGVAVLAAWLAMGTNGLAFALLRLVPAFGTMRLPCRYMFLFDLSVAVLAGVGAHWLSRLERPVERRTAVWLRGLLTGALALATVWLFGGWLKRDQFVAGISERLRLMHGFHNSDITPLVEQYLRQLGLNVALLLGGLSLALLLIMLAARSDRWRWMAAPLAWAGIVGTLVLFGRGYHTVIPARLVQEEPFTVRRIGATAPEGPFRVLQWDWTKLHSDVAVHRGWWPTDEHGYRQYIAALPGNYNLVWGLSNVRQEEWSALPMPHTKRLTSGILARGSQGGFAAVSPYMPWWNAAFVLSQKPLTAPSLSLVAEDRTRLYRVDDPAQRAWIVHEASVEADESRLMQRLASEPEGLRERVVFLAPPTPTRAPTRRGNDRARVGVGVGVREAKEEARIIRRSPTRVTVEAVLAREGYLVLGESWAPGWRAWVGGEPAPILRANVIHRAVGLPAGRHRVEFRYQPPEFRLGLYLSALGLAAWLALAVGRLGGRP
jgi:hypothetical protein